MRQVIGRFLKHLDDTHAATPGVLESEMVGWLKTQPQIELTIRAKTSSRSRPKK